MDGVSTWHTIQRRRSELALAIERSLDTIAINYPSDDTAIVSVTIDPDQLPATLSDQYEFPASKFNARIGATLDRDLFSLIEDNVHIDSGEEVSVRTLDRLQSITDPVIDRHIDRQRRQIDRYDVSRMADGPPLRDAESDTDAESGSDTDVGAIVRDVLDQAAKTIRQATTRLEILSRRLLESIRKLMKRLRE